MLIGIDGDTYYVAESLSYIGGVRAMIYSKNELLKTFEYVVLMDKFYKNDSRGQLCFTTHNLEPINISYEELCKK